MVNFASSRTLRWDEISAVEDGPDVMERRIVFVTIAGETVKSLVQTVTHGGHEVYLTDRQYQQAIEHLQQISNAD